MIDNKQQIIMIDTVCMYVRVCTNQKTFIKMNIYETKRNNASSNAVPVCVFVCA